MDGDKPRVKGNIERLFLLMVTIVLGLLFLSLYIVLQRDFTDVQRRLDEGTMVNLNDKNPGIRIKNLLEKGFYFEDKKDIALIQSVVTASLKTEENQLDNIGELNKRKYSVVADEAFATGGQSFKKRVAASRSLLGYTGDDSVLFVQEKIKPSALPAITNTGMGKHTISGTKYMSKWIEEKNKR